jgi:hypothetical protein
MGSILERMCQIIVIERNATSLELIQWTLERNDKKDCFNIRKKVNQFQDDEHDPSYTLRLKHRCIKNVLQSISSSCHPND